MSTALRLLAFPLAMVLFFAGLLAVQQLAAVLAWDWPSYGVLLVAGLLLLVRGIKLAFLGMDGAGLAPRGEG